MRVVDCVKVIFKPSRWLLQGAKHETAGKYVGFLAVEAADEETGSKQVEEREEA